MNNDRRNRLEDVRNLLILASDITGINPWPTKNTYERWGSIRLILIMAQQRLTEIYYEEKAAYASTPKGFRERASFLYEPEETFPIALQAIGEAIGSYIQGYYIGPVRLKALIDKACEATNHAIAPI